MSHEDEKRYCTQPATDVGDFAIVCEYTEYALEFQ